MVHLALVKDVPSSAIAQLEKIQRQFVWKNGDPQLQHTTLCNEFEQRRLKYFLQNKKSPMLLGQKTL